MASLLSGVSESTVPVTGGSAALSQTKLQENLNQFLNLLVTQLKNQDPLDPMDSTEFTSQLVQFASVEQQIYTNANMEKLLNLEETSQISTMVNFIGNAVEATGNQAQLQDGYLAASYELPQNAKDVTISIQNAKGITVYFADGETGAGKHGFTWDGKSANGTQQPDGAYTIQVNAKDPSDTLLTVKQTVFGKITGAGVDDGKANLFMGEVIIPIEKVLTVEEAPDVDG